MERWRNKVAVVTGASSGIGAASALDLVRAGMIVAALGRREYKLEELKTKLPEELRSKLHAIKCDVTDESQVINTFKWVEDNLGPVHVLVNSAGIYSPMDLTGKDCSERIRKNFDTDVVGAVFCVRETFHQMKRYNIDGHIVLINSIAAHYVPICPFGSVNIYSAVKYATRALNETYRQEFSNSGTNIKITSVSPGAVDSEIVPVMFRNTVDYTTLKSEDVSSAVMYCISTPPNVQIQELIIRPIHEKF